ncbi:MAG: response regulator, partial [Anaerolineales bacterium]|nr:response regulator [Anaerolineales bacterium]
MNQPIRILLVDDSPYFLEAARDFLQFQEALEMAGAATNAEEAIAQSQKLEFDIVLLDLNLARSSGLDLIPIFKKEVPDAKIIVLTMM